MNELALADKVASPRLMLAINTLADVRQMVDLLCSAGAVPKAFIQKADGQPNKAAMQVAIIAGRELGFGPMKSLQVIAVINGIPCVYGDAMLAMVYASGQMEDFEETQQTGSKPEDVVATCRVKRKGYKTPVVRTFSWGDAMKANLPGRVKDGPWTTHPKRMLQFKARNFALRDAFADIIGGYQIVEAIDDEGRHMKDITPAEQEPEAVPPRPERPKRQRKAATVEAEPAPEASAEPVEVRYALTWPDGQASEAFLPGDALRELKLALEHYIEQADYATGQQLVELNQPTIRAIREAVPMGESETPVSEALAEWDFAVSAFNDFAEDFEREVEAAQHEVTEEPPAPPAAMAPIAIPQKPNGEQDLYGYYAQVMKAIATLPPDQVEEFRTINQDGIQAVGRFMRTWQPKITEALNARKKAGAA